ncbi:MAG: hypothetical protein OEZ36_07815 [Spirochaetota bacterium]|nr:hypothetical protein [Spirochaetota bacterium]
MKILLISLKHKQINNNYYVYPHFISILKSLSGKEYDILSIDENKTEIDFNIKADIVGISVYSATASRAYFLALHYKRLGATVVLGGPHASALPEEGLQFADSIIVGRAEGSWNQFLRDVKSNKIKKKYKSSLHLSDNHFEVDHPEHGDSELTHLYKKDYKILELAISKTWIHSLDKILDEIHQTKLKNLLLLDYDIHFMKKYSQTFFNELKHFKKNWMAQFSVDHIINNDFLHQAAESGCVCCELNITIPSEELHKRDDYLEQSFTAVQKLRDLGIHTIPKITFGYDVDNPTIFDNTLAFMEKTKLSHGHFEIYTPFPGSGLFYNLDRQNRIIDYNWDNYDFKHVVHKPLLMSPEDLQMGYEKVLKTCQPKKSFFSRFF